jgi:hypothetical protein
MLTAAAPIATIVVGPENLLRMMISFALQVCAATGLPVNPELMWMVAFFGIGCGCKDRTTNVVWPPEMR